MRLYLALLGTVAFKAVTMALSQAVTRGSLSPLMGKVPTRRAVCRVTTRLEVAPAVTLVTTNLPPLLSASWAAML
jgi:hypothetical protein